VSKYAKKWLKAQGTGLKEKNHFSLFSPVQHFTSVLIYRFSRKFFSFFTGKSANGLRRTDRQSTLVDCRVYFNT
jgi:hypothetical protein